MKSIVKSALLALVLVVSTLSLVLSDVKMGVKAQDLPDLAITDVYWEPQNPTTKVKIYCVFENIGKADVTERFNLKMYLDGNWKTSQYWFSWSFSPTDLPIKPDYPWTYATGEISMTHTAHKIRWEVDTLDQVPDADRSNNIMEKTLYWSTSSITTISTTIATRTSVSFTTTARSITETTMLASIGYVDYPKHVNMGETFKVSVDVNYALPQAGVLAVIVDDMATGHNIAEQFSDNTRYGGVAHFVLWMTAPNENVVWNLDIGLYLGITIGGVNSVENQEISIPVGSATITSATTATTSYIWSTQPTPTRTTTEMTETSSAATEPFLAGNTMLIGVIVVVAVVAVALMALMKRKPTTKPSVLDTSRTCSKCGKALPLDSEYCGECGERQV